MSASERTKVVYIIGTLQIGGAEWQMVDTATRLNRQVFLPKIYCLFGGGPFQTYAEQSHVEVTTFQATRNGHDTARKQHIPFWRSRTCWALYKWLKQEQPDVVHCYMYKPSVYGGILAKIAGVPVILTHRLRLGYFKDTKPYYQFIENFVNRCISGVIVNSKAVKQDVLQREQIRDKNVHVIHAGVDINRFLPADASPSSTFVGLQRRQELGIPENVPVIGMIANLFPYKGYQEFIEAAARIHQRYPDARFLCIGRDEGIQAELAQRSSELGCHDRVIFTGQVQNIPEMLQVIDIQVSASYEEGFSSAILEGMAMGKPFVATTVGGTPEAVEHNVTGFLIPPRNSDALEHAIITLLANPELALTFGRNGRKRTEDYFSMERAVSKLETLYLTLSKQ